MAYGYQYNDVTTNGSSLSAGQIGAQHTSLSQAGNAGVTTGVQNTDVTAGGVNPVGGTQNQGNFLRNADGSFNANNIGMVIGGIQTLGSLWNSYQQHKIAKEQLALQREAFRTNLANNTQTYNTALEDRIRARHHTEGRSSGETDAYLDEHSL